ncbi:hypothetical protein DRP07_07150 [Archaeoglobales archaeon]|nr:MAG: hypothetical protein DRP07_07150 [Archaeoglobales archaeon]
MTNAVGEKVAVYEYLPFGYQKEGPRTVTPFAFTGKPKDEESGLQYFGARYYDQLSRRFLSCDPKTKPDITLLIKHRILNFYVFENDNPINYIDPDGEIPILLAVGISAVVGVVIDYLSQYAEARKKTGISLYKYWISGEYPVEREAIVAGFSGLSGIVTGGIGTTNLPWWMKPVFNAPATYFISKAKSAALGEEFTTEEAISSGLAGAVSVSISEPLAGISQRIRSENAKATVEAVCTVIGNEESHKIYLKPVVRKINEELKRLPKQQKIDIGFYNPHEIKWNQMGLQQPAY